MREEVVPKPLYCEIRDSFRTALSICVPRSMLLLCEDSWFCEGPIHQVQSPDDQSSPTTCPREQMNR